MDGGLNVLVVEDNPDTASSLASLLGLVGHQVRVAGTGEQAMQAVETQHPDVALLDIGLPGMDGWDVARWIRSREGVARPLIIAITGYGSEGDRRRSLEAGIDMHFIKPADPEQLLDILASFQKGFRS
jgi:two-component system OmpR family response regulator